MKKILPRLLLFIFLFSLFSCTITKRKYTGGFYVNWRKKVQETVRPHPTLSYEEREKSQPPHRNGEVAFQGQNISATYKDISPQSAASRVQRLQKTELSKNLAPEIIFSPPPPKTMHVESVKARNRNNGLTGLEIGILNIIDLLLLIFFGHLQYLVFILGFFLIFLFLFISGLIYSFMGLNKEDKHRWMGFLGILIQAGVLTALIIVG